MSKNYSALAPVKFGFALGLWWGLGLLALGWCGMWWGYGLAFIQTFASIYIGYGASFVGGLLGFVWGFVDFFIFGLLIAWIYNRVLRK